MDIVQNRTELQEGTGESGEGFPAHTEPLVGTLEDWETGRYAPAKSLRRLRAYQNGYEKLRKSR